MVDMNESLLDLSTAVEPPLVFTVDGQPYKLRTISHLSKLEEARLRTLNKQEEFILAKIDAIDPNLEDKLMALHEKLFDLRIELITMMTSLPREKAEKLPPIQQQNLINYVGMEVAAIRKRMEQDDKVEDYGKTDAELDAEKGAGEGPGEE